MRVIEIEATALECEALAKLLEIDREKLRDRKNPPKGMTFGDVQDALTAIGKVTEALRKADRRVPQGGE